MRKSIATVTKSTTALPSAKIRTQLIRKIVKSFNVVSWSRNTSTLK